MVEVLVAGAGPAGSVAAYVLARAGVRVLLVDRASFPRPKLCGDTLNPGALALLARLGLGGVAEAAALPLDGMIVTSPTGVRVEGAYGPGWSGRAMSRKDFDHRLLERAAAAGAHVELGVRVTEPIVDQTGGRFAIRGARLEGRGRSQRVPAAITVAADGRRSTLGVGLGLIHQPPEPRRWAVGAYFTGVAGLSTRGEMHIRDGYYIGVAPLPGGLANACVVTLACPELARPADFLIARLLGDPLLADRFASAVPVTTACSVGPLAVDASAAGLPGLLLAGDAAGFIDPMTGDGLRFAIQGGQLAAQAALAMLETPRLAAHVHLRRLRQDAFATKFRLNRALRRIVASPGAIKAGTWSATIVPGLVRRLIAAAGDVALAQTLQTDAS
jgi:flavin-dependent dehydrogenase